MPILYPGFGDYGGYGGGYEEDSPSDSYSSPFDRPMFGQDEPNPFLKRNNPFLRDESPQEPVQEASPFRVPMQEPPPEPNTPPAPASPERTGFEFKEGPLSGRYREFLQEAPPNRADFKPTKMQRLGAFLDAMGSNGGYRGAKDVLDRPYNQAVADRLLREKELSAGAKEEDESQNEAFRKWHQQRQLEQGQEKINIDKTNKESLAERRQAMTRIQDWRAKNPGFDKVVIKGGNIHAFNKGTGEMKNTGISSGTMTDEDLLETNNTNRLEQIAKSGSEARETERTRQEGRIELNEARDLSAKSLERLRQSGRISLEDAKIIGREQIMDFAVRHPKYTKVEVKGGNYHFVNPNDPTDSVDSGISTGTLSEDDSIVRRLGGGTTTVTSVNPQGTQRTVKTTRTPGTVPTPTNPAVPATPSRTRPATAPVTSSPTAKTMTDPDGGVHDISTWSDRDIQQARLRNWK